jgi:signal peptidase II
MTSRRIYFALASVIVVLDQLTKIWAHASLPGRGVVEVIPGVFNLAYSRNPGGLFGYFGGLPDPWRLALLTVLPLAAVGMIGWFLLRGDDSDRRSLYGLALILGGAVGNLLDRMFRGEVVDFLDVYASAPSLANWFIAKFGTAHWPTFNLADSAIVCGAGLLILTIVRPHPARPAAEQAASVATRDPAAADSAE